MCSFSDIVKLTIYLRLALRDNKLLGLKKVSMQANSTAGFIVLIN